VVSVDPAVQAQVCGNGVGVLGRGTGATCSGTQDGGSSPGGRRAGLLDVSPTVQADVCGTGVAVLGTGTTAECSDAQSSGGGTPGGAGTGVAGTVVDAAIGPAATIGRLLTGGWLPFTGGDTLAAGIAGLGLAAIGGGMLQLRRIGYTR